MDFYMDIIPPTATAQMKKVRVVNGKPMFYEPEKVKAAKNLLIRGLIRHAPFEPMEGPLALKVEWRFPKGKSHKDGEWRTTRPDTDNLQKLLKDCMTYCGFWKDDAQVVREEVEKLWADQPGLHITITRLEAKKYG